MIHSSATMVISENTKERRKHDEEKADICIVRDHTCGF